MSRLKPAALVALTTFVIVGLLFPSGAVAGFGTATTDSASTAASTTGQQANSTGTNVSVGVGEQLSTVTTSTSEDIRTDAENAGFEQRLNAATATDRAELIGERAAELRNSSERLRAEYANLTAAAQQGEISVDAFAQRLAGLSAAATNIDSSVDRLSKRAAQLSTAERRAVGVTEDDLAAITGEINSLTGQTASAVLGQFTGQSGGKINIEIGDGIELSVESDGERSREFERPRDNDGMNSYELNQSQALAIAESRLSQPSEQWTLTGVSTDDGAYEFEFRYTGPGEGEAEVSVDGSSGTVFALEESIEAPEDDERKELDELAVGVNAGEPAPGANVTLSVTGNGEPAANATVRINGEQVGTTDESGQIAVGLPDEAEIDIEAELNDAEGGLEFEFEEDDEEKQLGATADTDGDTITVFVVLDGRPVEGATVTLNENVTKTTGSDGTAAFTITGSELDIDINYQDREAELEYELEADDEEDDESEDEEDEESEDESEDEEDEESEEESEDEEDEESEDESEDEEDEPEEDTEDEQEDGEDEEETEETDDDEQKDNDD